MGVQDYQLKGGLLDYSTRGFQTNNNNMMLSAAADFSMMGNVAKQIGGGLKDPSSMGLSEFQLNELSAGAGKTSGLSDFQIKSLSSYTKDILTSSDKLINDDAPLDLSSFKITAAGGLSSSSPLNDPFFESIKMAGLSSSSDGDVDIAELTLDNMMPGSGKSGGYRNFFAGIFNRKKYKRKNKQDKDKDQQNEMREYDYVPREHRFIHSDGRFTNVFEDPSITPQDGIGLSEEWYKYSDYMMEHRNYYDFGDMDQPQQQQRQPRPQRRQMRRPPQNLQQRQQYQQQQQYLQQQQQQQYQQQLQQQQQQQQEQQQNDREKQKLMNDLAQNAATQRGASFNHHHDNSNHLGNFKIYGLSNDFDDSMTMMMQPSSIHFAAAADEESMVADHSRGEQNLDNEDLEPIKELLRNSTEQSEFKPLSEEEVSKMMHESTKVQVDDIHKEVYEKNKIATDEYKFEDEFQSDARNDDEKYKNNMTYSGGNDQQQKDVKL